jgi:hypothetical protein
LVRVLPDIEQAAFERHYPPGYLHEGVNTAEDLARVRGVARQQDMLAEYARRKAAGEFPDGPEVRT